MSLFILISMMIFIALGPNVTYAETYRPIDLIEIAIRRNPEIRARQNDIAAFKAKSDQAGLWDNPSIELGFEKQDTAPGATNFGKIGFSQFISRPGRLRVRKDLAVNFVAAGEVDQQAYVLELRGTVLQLIYRYKVAAEKSAHTKERLARLRIVGQYLNSRPFAAPQKRTEVLIVRAKLFVLQKELLNQEANRKIAWNDLNLYVGLDGEPDIEVPWVKTSAAIPFADLSRKAESQSPELKHEIKELSIQESQAQLARYETWSGFTLTGGYADGRGSAPEKDYSLGVTIPIPILNGNHFAISAENSQVTAKKERLNWLKEKIKSNLKSAFDRFEAERLALQDLPGDSIPLMERDMKSVDSGFKKGQVDLISYLEADAQHFESLNAIYDTQVDFIASQTNLAYLVGEAPPILEK